MLPVLALASAIALVCVSASVVFHAHRARTDRAHRFRSAEGMDLYEAEKLITRRAEH